MLDKILFISLEICSSSMLIPSLFESPNSMKINSESKITMNESENSFKIKANIKVHDKPDNTILVKMNGRYAQKIGSYNTSVDLS